MRRRDFLAMSTLSAASAVVTLSAHDGVRRPPQSGRAFAFDTNPLGRTLKAPDGRAVFDYVTKKAPDTDMTASSVCCFHPLMTPAGERVTVFGQGHGHSRRVLRVAPRSDRTRLHVSAQLCGMRTITGIDVRLPAVSAASIVIV
jgi:hypothetical protein